ncbi:MAG TPA: GNAT family N-acetyltransferase [Gammaproteobacteria bacterium]
MNKLKTMPDLHIRELQEEEFLPLGRLMVEVYSGLEGFPTPEEQPRYYDMLVNIGRFTEKKDAKVLVAISPGDTLIGGVVYFGDMSEYGSGGTATRVKNASGIRLLAIDPKFRGTGAGRALTEACMQLAREKGHAQVILHTTQAMQIAWKMYEKLGFERAPDLDFMQEALPVFGFRLELDKT